MEEFKVLNFIFAIFQILIAIGLIGFWVMFYFTEYKNKDRKMSEAEFKHELSFPLPEIYDIIKIPHNLGESIKMNISQFSLEPEESKIIDALKNQLFQTEKELQKVYYKLEKSNLVNLIVSFFKKSVRK